jgi:hypothetical protein
MKFVSEEGHGSHKGVALDPCHQNGRPYDVGLDNSEARDRLDENLIK